MKLLHDKYKKPVGLSVTKGGYGGLYQWAGKQFGSYKEFIIQNNLIEYTNYQNNWNDALCYRLIKDQLILNGGPFKEILKKEYKRAYAYIYNQHGSFENFLNTFDLQDCVDIRHTIYTDEIVKREIMETYTLLGGKVYSKWLHENGFGEVANFLIKKG